MTRCSRWPLRWALQWSAAACALAVLPAAPAFAGEAPAAVVAPVGVVRPALWKVADDDTTIWLFGTIHILPEDVNWYTGPVASAFDASQELVTEIPIDEADSAQGVIAEMSRRTDGKALRDTLLPAERAGYDAGMASIGLPPQAFDANDAWFAALMLTLIPLKVAGYNTESGVDAQVGAKAKARHMENHALENAAYQIALFDTLPEPTQRAYLDEVVEALPTVRNDIDAMVRAWRAGDAEGLARLLTEDESDPQMRKVLLTDRNIAWAQWIKARLDRPGTVFVAVGAGHLAGPGSVQDVLGAAKVHSVRVQ